MDTAQKKRKGDINVGPASLTVAQHYFTIGPMYRVIRVVSFKDIKRQCTGMAARENTGQSPNFVSRLGWSTTFDRH